MSDGGALTVPVAGWYPDRNESNTVRWWDGQQWTDQTQSTAPAAAAFAEPVSAAAFGFVPVEPNPVAQIPVAQNPVTRAASPSSAPVPGWYPDNHDRSLQRWWDGTQWTAHTTPTAVQIPVAAAPVGRAAGSNSHAIAALIVGIGSILINPLGASTVAAVVLGVVALRRAKNYAPQLARRGMAIAGMVIAVVGLIVNIVFAVLVIEAQHASQTAFHQTVVEQQLRTDLQTRLNEGISSVDCPVTVVVKTGNTFACTVTTAEGETLSVTGTFATDGGDYDYVYAVQDPDLSNS